MPFVVEGKQGGLTLPKACQHPLTLYTDIMHGDLARKAEMVDSSPIIRPQAGTYTVASLHDYALVGGIPLGLAVVRLIGVGTGVAAKLLASAFAKMALTESLAPESEPHAASVRQKPMQPESAIK
jgi:hypothetical protein